MGPRRQTKRGVAIDARPLSVFTEAEVFGVDLARRVSLAEVQAVRAARLNGR
jgi:hypothetical protein